MKLFDPGSLLFATWSLLTFPTMVSAVNIRKEAMDLALNFFVSRLPDVVEFDQELPLIKKSFNEFLHEDGYKGLIRELAGFQEMTTEEIDGFLNMANSAGTCGPNKDMASGFDLEVVRQSGSSATEVRVKYCVEQETEVAISTSQAFSFLENSIEIESDGDATVVVKSHLTFSVNLSNEKTTPVQDKYFKFYNADIDAGLFVDSSADLMIGVGMLDLFSEADFDLNGRLKLHVCNMKNNLNGPDYDTSYNDCSLHEDLITPGEDEDYRVYLDTKATYSIEGSVMQKSGAELDSFNLPAELATLKVKDPNFLDKKAPFVDFKGFDWKEHLALTPQNAVHLLRLVDSAITRAQENEALMTTNVPGLNRKLSDVFATGSLVTRRLNQFFVKVEDFEDRATKSMVIEGNPSFQFPSARTEEIDLVIIRSDLSANPEVISEVKDLATKDGNTLCPILIDQPDDLVDLMTQLRESIEGCNLKVCDSRRDLPIVDAVQFGFLRTVWKDRCMQLVDGKLKMTACTKGTFDDEAKHSWILDDDKNLFHFLETELPEILEERWEIDPHPDDEPGVFQIRNSKFRGDCLAANYDSVYIKECHRAAKEQRWFWDFGDSHSDLCLENPMGDYQFCDCDMVMEIGDETNMSILGTTAYTDRNNSVKNDVSLIALFHSNGEPDEPIFGFDAHDIPTPAFVPRFTNWKTFTELINQEIKTALDSDTVSVDLVFHDDVIPKRLDLDVSFQIDKKFEASFDAEIEMGDLADLSVTDGNIIIDASVEAGTGFAAIFGPDDDLSLTITTRLGSTCANFTCPSTEELLYKMEYALADGTQSEVIETLPRMAFPFSPKEVLKDKSRMLGRLLLDVKEIGKDTLGLKFRPDVAKIVISPSGRNCIGVTDPSERRLVAPEQGPHEAEIEEGFSSAYPAPSNSRELLESVCQLKGKKLGELSLHNLACCEHSALSGFGMENCPGGKSNIYRWNCADIEGVDDENSPIRSVSTQCDGGGNSDIYYLKKHKVQCDEGEVLNRWQLERCDGNDVRIDYDCKKLPFVTEEGCSTHRSSCSYIHEKDIHWLDRQNVQCPAGKVLSGWHFDQYGCKNSKDFQTEYTCCPVPNHEVHLWSCPEGFKFDSYVYNVYGFRDYAQSKPNFHFGIGETYLRGEVSVAGDLDISTNIGGVIGATADIKTDIGGSLDLTINPKADGHMIYSKWLESIVAITSDKRKEGFFIAQATFDGSIEGTATGLAPFDDLSTSFKGEMSPLVIDFMAAKKFNKPSFSIDVDMPTIGDVKDMSFQDIVILLSTALEFLVGVDDGSEGIKSCRNGLLGKKLFGQNVFQKKIPVIGMSACQSAMHLHTFVSAVEDLMEEAEEGSSSTFTVLDAKLTSMLADAVGGQPMIDITPSDSETHSNLDVTIVLHYAFDRTDDITIEMSEVMGAQEKGSPEALFAKQFLPETQGSAKIPVVASLTVTLDIGLEIEKATKKISSYFRGSTGLDATLYTDAEFDFIAGIGPMKADVSGRVKVGVDPLAPFAITAELPGDRNKKYYVESVDNLLDQLDVNIDGPLQAELSAVMDDLFFPPPFRPPPGIFLNVSIDDFSKFLEGGEDAMQLDMEMQGPEEFEIPSFFDLLMADPQAIIDAVDDVFRIVEEASLGSDGIITKFPAPLIQEGLGESLGAGKENNILANARKSVVMTLEEKFSAYSGDGKDGIPGFLADELTKFLSRDDIDMLMPDKEVTVSCFTYDEYNKAQLKRDSCSQEEDPTSLMWVIPFGKTFTIDLDLDFVLDTGKFPLVLAMTGDSVPTLGIAWEFNLGFGFDETEGIFMSTFDDAGSELQVKAWFSLENKCLEAGLRELTATLGDLDIHVAANAFVDVVKPAELNEEGPMKGRLTRADIRKLNQASDLFEISAIAGAIISTPVRFAVKAASDTNSKFNEVAKYVPKIDGEIAIQIRKQADFDLGKRRRLINEVDRRRLGELPEVEDHPALSMFRWLAYDEASDADDVLKSDFGPNFEPCPLQNGEWFCGKLNKLELNIDAIMDVLNPILSEFVDPTGQQEGYLDKIVEPFLPLYEPLKKISDLTGDKTSVLDTASFVYPDSGADTVIMLIEIYNQIKHFVTDISDGAILLADECDLTQGFECFGGVFTRKEENAARLLEDLGEEEADEVGADGENCDDIEDDGERFRCKADGIQGLSFPFLTDLKSVVGIIQGTDVTLVEFTPPDIVFAFSHSLGFIIHPAPKVTLGVYFEFTIRFKYGVSLDSSGIREAIVQQKPVKALNSFALMDTFDGVDEPLILMTAGIGLEATASAGLVRISVRGGILIVANVDFYDPYPETSGGLVRPYELISYSLNPLDWFEFEVSMYLDVSLSIKIGVKVFKKFKTIKKWKYRWLIPLVEPLHISPDKPPKIVDCDRNTGIMTLEDLGDSTFECTSLGGTLGSETIECVNSNEVFQSCGRVSKIQAFNFNSTFLGKALFRGIFSPLDITELEGVSDVELDYTKMLHLSKDEFYIGETEATFGFAKTTFDPSLQHASVRLPNPDIFSLQTIVGSDCRMPWELTGYTNLLIHAADIQWNCDITAHGGIAEAQVIVDLRPTHVSEECSGRHEVIISTNLEEQTKIEVSFITEEFGTRTNTILVDKTYNDIVVKMTECEDLFEIHSTVDVRGSVAVYTYGGENKVKVGYRDGGIDSIHKKIIVHGGGTGNTKLVVDDMNSAEFKSSFQKLSASLHGLLKGPVVQGTGVDGIPAVRNFETIDFDHVNTVDLTLNDKQLQTFSVLNFNGDTAGETNAGRRQIREGNKSF